MAWSPSLEANSYPKEYLEARKKSVKEMNALGTKTSLSQVSHRPGIVDTVKSVALAIFHPSRKSGDPNPEPIKAIPRFIGLHYTFSATSKERGTIQLVNDATIHLFKFLESSDILTLRQINTKIKELIDRDSMRVTRSVEREVLALQTPPCLLKLMGGIDKLYNLPLIAKDEEMGPSVLLARKWLSDGRIQFVIKGFEEKLTYITENVRGAGQAFRNQKQSVEWSVGPDVTLYFYSDGTDSYGKDKDDPLTPRLKRLTDFLNENHL